MSFELSQPYDGSEQPSACPEGPEQDIPDSLDLSFTDSGHDEDQPDAGLPDCLASLGDSPPNPMVPSGYEDVETLPAEGSAATSEPGGDGPDELVHEEEPRAPFMPFRQVFSGNLPEVSYKERVEVADSFGECARVAAGTAETEDEPVEMDCTIDGRAVRLSASSANSWVSIVQTNDGFPVERSTYYVRASDGVVRRIDDAYDSVKKQRLDGEGHDPSDRKPQTGITLLDPTDGNVIATRLAQSLGMNNQPIRMQEMQGLRAMVDRIVYTHGQEQLAAELDKLLGGEFGQ